MKSFKITIEYDGSKYCGWQRQKEKKRIYTVQGKIEACLYKIFNKNITITGSGRTDSGVHAKGQVASFKTDTKIPQSNILKALNSYLPDDIAIKDIKEVSLSFNARFSTKKKWYQYIILSKQIRSPLYNNFTAHVQHSLNIAAMKRAAKIIKGKHDFSGIVTVDNENKVREIYKLTVRKEKELIYIDVVGNGFLYKMVRRIAGILIDVGRGKIGLEDVRKLILGKQIDSEVQTAPAKGLTLMKVYY